jgi:GNAT superfamily N-acetyltransferase
MLRKLERVDMDTAALVRRTSFEDAFPWLVGLHTAEEDQWFFRKCVFNICEVWGAFDGPEIVAIIAFRDGWIDQLYVLPSAQGRGLGGRLLETAKHAHRRLQLWTFQRNLRARRFYEARGFVLARVTDGAANEEREPDALYTWVRNDDKPQPPPDQ